MTEVGKWEEGELREADEWQDLIARMRHQVVFSPINRDGYQFNPQFIVGPVRDSYSMESVDR